MGPPAYHGRFQAGCRFTISSSITGSAASSSTKQFNYQQSNIRYRHYGKNIELIIEKAATYEDGPEKEALIRTIANHHEKILPQLEQEFGG